MHYPGASERAQWVKATMPDSLAPVVYRHTDRKNAHTHIYILNYSGRILRVLTSLVEDWIQFPASALGGS